MGMFDWLTGGGEQKQTETKTTAMDPRTQAYAQWLQGQAQGSLPGVGDVPIQGTAGFTADQLAAFQRVRDLQGNFNNDFDTARNLTMQGAAGLDTAGVSDLYSRMSEPQLASLRNQQAIQMKKATDAARVSGGGDASRVGVVQGVLGGQQNLAEGSLSSNIYAQAVAAKQREQEQKFAGAASLSAQAAGRAGLGYQDVAQLYGSGQAQQGLTQQQMNALYAQQQGQYQNPYQNYAAASSILPGLTNAYGNTTTDVKTVPTPSLLSTLGGMAAAAAGTYFGGPAGGAAAKSAWGSLTGGGGKGGSNEGLHAEATGGRVGFASGGSVGKGSLGEIDPSYQSPGQSMSRPPSFNSPFLAFMNMIQQRQGGGGGSPATGIAGGGIDDSGAPPTQPQAPSAQPQGGFGGLPSSTAAPIPPSPSPFGGGFGGITQPQNNSCSMPGMRSGGKVRHYADGGDVIGEDFNALASQDDDPALKAYFDDKRRNLYDIGIDKLKLKSLTGKGDQAPIAPPRPPTPWDDDPDVQPNMAMGPSQQKFLASAGASPSVESPYGRESNDTEALAFNSNLPSYRRGEAPLPSIIRDGGDSSLPMATSARGSGSYSSGSDSPLGKATRDVESSRSPNTFGSIINAIMGAAHASGERTSGGWLKNPGALQIAGAGYGIAKEQENKQIAQAQKEREDALREQIANRPYEDMTAHQKAEEARLNSLTPFQKGTLQNQRDAIDARGNWQYLGPSTKNPDKSVFQNAKTGEIEERDIGIGAKAQRPKSLGPLQIPLEKKATAYSQSVNAENEFRDNYAGFQVKPIGDINAWIGRNLKAADPNQVAMAKWWQDYQAYKGAVRNGLYGSALTKYEIAEWDKQDINPNMRPDVIRHNLDRQNNIVKNGLMRHGHSLLGQGHTREAIEPLFGFELGDKPPKTIRDKDRESGTPQPKGGGPSLREFLDKAKVANPNVPEKQLIDYYNKTYGGQ